jgi:RNA polymerase sigma factor (sigma-70 family)
MGLSEQKEEQKFLESVINGEEPYKTTFYEEYDMLIWDIAHKWYPSINLLSKKQYELEDIHNELWIHIYKNLEKCDLNKAKLSTWMYLVSNSKCGMIKRSLKAQKNDIVTNECKDVMINNPLDTDECTELFDLVGDNSNIDDIIIFQEFLLDYIYSLLELVDACTEKERKVYLLKIMGKSQIEIAEETSVSKSYIPKIFKRLKKKFRLLYDTLYDQCYIDKEERDRIAKDLLNKEPVDYICNKYDLETETVCICYEILRNVLSI